MTDPELVRYYHLRAASYDRLYERVDRQDALQEASAILKTVFSGKDVFEVACGTGYWTQQIAQTAKSILATDINDAMLDIAKSKIYSPAPVTFVKRDFYETSGSEKHECLFGGFIWSHILKQDMLSFIDTMNKHVLPGGKVVFMDNLFVEGSNLPVAQTDPEGNTYQLRSLDNGEQHLVLKNFPDEESFQQLLKDKADSMKFHRLQYYWILEYTTH